MKIGLNKSRNSSERYYLINESMGSAGEPANSPNYLFCIANGVDRGNGYQGYHSITQNLKNNTLPEDVKSNCIKELKKLGYNL